MRKNVWIFNHYATDTFLDLGGRHYYFADHLIKRGHKATIFCASTVHNSSENFDTGNKLHKTAQTRGIPYVFIKTPNYNGNGWQRVKNMLTFYKRLFPVVKEYVKIHGKPDVILASSVHPLTLVAGIKIAKKLGIPCLCEVRDLWPESLVTYGFLKKNSMLTKLLYQGEKWIYKRADKLIFTMEGGEDYIKNRKWNKENGGPIDLRKVHHINNGVDLETFNYNRDHYILEDIDLNNQHHFKVIYTGSIRKVNNIMEIVEIAEIIQKKGYNNIKFLIYGKGTEKERLEKYCQDHKLSNIKFKGFVEKKYVPYILSKSNLNIMRFHQNNLKQYGASLNKMFDYFASGKPTISGRFEYDLVKKYNCGIVLANVNKEQYANAIIELSKISKDQYETYCKNALLAAQDYDFKVLTKKLEQLF